jgi:small-conductance mechanosensitive channel
VIFPMRRRDALAAGEETLRNVMHIPATVVMGLFFVLAVGFGYTLLGKRFQYYSYGTIAILFVGAVLQTYREARLPQTNRRHRRGLRIA